MRSMVVETPRLETVDFVKGIRVEESGPGGSKAENCKYHGGVYLRNVRFLEGIQIEASGPGGAKAETCKFYKRVRLENNRLPKGMSRLRNLTLQTLWPKEQIS